MSPRMYACHLPQLQTAYTLDAWSLSASPSAVDKSVVRECVLLVTFTCSKTVVLSRVQAPFLSVCVYNELADVLRNITDSETT